MALNLRQIVDQFFGASGSNHSGGLVPDPGSSAGTSRFLREDATWAAPPSLATPVSVPNGGTGDSSLAAYAVLCGGTTTTNPVQSVASLGTSGQVLTSNGAAALPTFQAGGAMALINTLTASNSATLSDTTSLTATYSKYLITFENIVPVTNAVTFLMQVSTNGGSSYLSSSYISGGSVTDGSVNTWGGGSSAAEIFIAGANTGFLLGNSASYGLCGQGIFYNPAGTSSRKVFAGEVVYLSGTTSQVSSWAFGKFAGYQDGGNTAVNAIQFSMSSGNISSGTIHIYGIT